MADEPKPAPTFAESLAALFMPQPSGDITFSQLAAALAGLPATPTIQLRWFKNETIYIDGYAFEDCRFDGCQLVTEMATFAFRRCYIAPNCRVYFNGAALKTVRLLMHLLRGQNRIKVRQDELGLYATLNTDGTFSRE